jgi:hypothetical protein
MIVTGRKGTHILNKIKGEVAAELIDLMKPYMMDGVVESLRISANEFLVSSKISYSDILNCFMGRPGCPFDL